MRHTWTFLAVGIFLTAAFAGCLAEPETKSSSARSAVERKGGLAARDPLSADFKPHVVVAVIDTGVNPYHAEFAEGYDWADPVDYIPGYPNDTTVLKLSEFKSPSGTNRDSADAALWGTTAPRTLYRVEGTKIVGLISFGSALPGAGHGTMTSSRATGNTISVGGTAVRLVHVLGFSAESVLWAANQPWIDILSISSGVTAGGVVPVAGNAVSPNEMKAFQEAAHKKPFFASSGNGVGNAGLLGFPSWTRGPSGVPDVISVGANDNGKMSQWHNQHSYIVGDGCGNPSAADNTPTLIRNTGGGTSSATPFSAGAGAALVLEARRLLGDAHVGTRYSDLPIASFSPWKSGYDGDAKVILAQGNASLHGITEGPLADGVFTLQEFKDVVYHTAVPGGSDDKSDGDACVGPAGAFVPTQGLPRDVLAQFEGYGEVNGKSTDLAKEVLSGAKKNPVRPGDDTWYQHFYTLRSATLPRT